MIDKAALPPRREARVYEGEKEVMGRSGSDGGVFGSGVLCVMRCVLGVRLLPWRVVAFVAKYVCVERVRDSCASVWGASEGSVDR